MEKKNEKCCVGYARVSTEEQAREGVSLDNQIRKIELYAELNGLNLIDVIVDEGISAKNLNRPGVQRVLEMARRKEIGCIVIYKLDRMFRNTIDALRTSQMLDRKGIALHSINEKLDTQSAMGKFFFTLMASIAEMERNVISERTSDAMQSKIEKKETTGNVRYGYRLSEDGIHVELDRDEQNVIRLIQEMKKEGSSLRRIADELNSLGFTTRRGTEWKHTYIYTILKANQ